MHYEKLKLRNLKVFDCIKFNIFIYSKIFWLIFITVFMINMRMKMYSSLKSHIENTFYGGHIKY